MKKKQPLVLFKFDYLVKHFSEYGHLLGSVIYRHKNLFKGLSRDSCTSDFFVNHLSTAPFLIAPLIFFLSRKIAKIFTTQSACFN
jgi:hypothetical protein